MALRKIQFDTFIEKYPRLSKTIPWIFNFFSILYFIYISWWASVDFNGFTSMLFGIPILTIVLAFAYFLGTISAQKSNPTFSSILVTKIIAIVLVLFYLSGFFPGLKFISEMPVKVVTKLSKMMTGISPDQWARPRINNNN